MRKENVFFTRLQHPNEKDIAMKYWILIILCFCFYSCGDEGIEDVLQGLSAPSAPDVAITGVPPEIQSMVWDRFGTREELIAELADIQQGDHNWQERIGWYIRVISKMDRKRIYYNRYINAGGIAIVGNQTVNNQYFLMAKEIVLRMTKKHPEIRAQLLPRHEFYLVLLEAHTRSWELPEFLYLPFEDNKGGSCGGLQCWSRVGYGYDNVRPMSVFVHEFGHAIHLAINGNTQDSRLNPPLDPTFDARLKLAYENALEFGIWSGLYAEKNKDEYWAEGVHTWFYDIGPDRQFPTYADFATHDPLLDELLDEWFAKDSFHGEY